jgi:hypothetical protein
VPCPLKTSSEFWPIIRNLNPDCVGSAGLPAEPQKPISYAFITARASKEQVPVI